MTKIQSSFGRLVIAGVCLGGIIAVATPSQAQTEPARDRQAGVEGRVGGTDGKAAATFPDEKRREAELSRESERSRIGDETGRDPRRDKATGVGTVNKASGLMGLDVHNPQKEKLGTIKDVVLDMETGRISYVVMSSGGFAGIGSRLVALPSRAFSRSADGEGLVLDMERARVESAPRITADNWPDVNSREFASYWNLDENGVGGSVDTEVGRRTSQGQERIATDPDAARIDPNQRNRPEGRTPLSPKEVSPAPRAGASDGKEFSGRIVAVNPEKGTVTVERDGEVRSFTMSEKPRLHLGLENRNPSLVDFKAGYSVNVGYHEENGAWVAHSLMRSDPPPTK